MCAIIDIDDFKQVNDSRGHIEGDALLREIGVILRDNCRATDVASRMGGDEFVLLLERIGLPEALRRLDAMVALIKGSTAASPCTPTVSIGVYATGLDDLTYDAVIDKADKALYEAKHRGKNRICVYGAVQS